MTDKQIPVFASNPPDSGSGVGAEINKLFGMIREKFTQAPSSTDWREGKPRTVDDVHATAGRKSFILGSWPNRWQVYVGETRKIWDPYLGGLFADPERMKLPLEALEEYSL